MEKGIYKFRLLLSVLFLVCCANSSDSESVNTYTIIYNKNSATGGVVPIDGTSYEAGVTGRVFGNPGNLIKISSIFAGWNTKADGTGLNYTVNVKIKLFTDITLYAKWIDAYAITYNSNYSTGGISPMDNTYYESGVQGKVLDNNGSLVKMFFDFKGWNTKANGTGTDYFVGSDIILTTADIALYAKWVANTNFTIIYDKNSAIGGAVPVDGIWYEPGAKGTVLGNVGHLVKTSYIFKGWNTKVDGSGVDYAANGKITLLGDITLYVKWANTYTITYNMNRARKGTVPVDTILYESGARGTVFGNIGSLVKTSFVFEGWNTKADGTGTDYAPLADIVFLPENIILYAKWADAYTFIYHKNGATGGIVPVDFGIYESGVKGSVRGNTGNLVKSSFVFRGWNTKANGRGIDYAPSAELVFISANIILYARWDNAYTITYNLNGATGGAVPVDGSSYGNRRKGIVLGNTGNLVKTSFIFKGWSTKADGTGIYYAPSADIVILWANIILYAKWSHAYTITYNLNGATGGVVPVDTIQYESGSNVKIWGNIGRLEKVSFVFKGWNSKADGTGIIYTPSADIVVTSESLVLYAKWIHRTGRSYYHGWSYTGPTP